MTYKELESNINEIYLSINKSIDYNEPIGYKSNTSINKNKVIVKFWDFNIVFTRYNVFSSGVSIKYKNINKLEKHEIKKIIKKNMNNLYDFRKKIFNLIDKFYKD